MKFLRDLVAIAIGRNADLTRQLTSDLTDRTTRIPPIAVLLFGSKHDQTVAHTHEVCE